MESTNYLKLPHITYSITIKDKFHYILKKPGRYQISRPMRIVAPIFLFLLMSKKGLKDFFCQNGHGSWQSPQVDTLGNMGLLIEGMLLHNHFSILPMPVGHVVLESLIYLKMKMHSSQLFVITLYLWPSCFGSSE